MLAVSPLLDALHALTLALCRQSFAFIGTPLSAVGGLFAFVGDTVSFVGDMFAFIGDQVAPRLLSLALRESSLALFQRSGAPIQVVWIGRLLVTGHA